MSSQLEINKLISETLMQQNESLKKFTTALTLMHEVIEALRQRVELLEQKVHDNAH